MVHNISHLGAAMISADITFPSKSEVLPYFQPIVSLQTRRIFGYEALGRRAAGSRIESLGPFFADSRASARRHVEIDRHLRLMAVRKMSAAGGMLFLNLKPSWIYRAFRESGELWTLGMLEANGFDPRRIVIEITEEEFAGPLQELTDILELYRDRGCTIAIDDIGSGFSNFDRIALLQPKIMKIDLKIIKRSVSHAGYKALLQSFAILAEQAGASLLVEGVETKEDLRGALQAGARYVQGYLFSPAQADLQAEGAYAELLHEEITQFAGDAVRRTEQLMALQMELNGLMETEDWRAAVGGDADAAVERLLGRLAPSTRRVYLCREDGSQVSSNFSRKAGGSWDKEERFRGSNWSWRPYFMPNIVMMKRQRQGILSQVYRDLDTSLPIRTFSCPFGDGHYLFVDIGEE
jgi:EAL domain-containing protein (putative c-di-GMP-specific phosphodiesterase class I)